MVDVAFFTHENLAAQAVTIVRFTTFIVVREVSCCLWESKKWAAVSERERERERERDLLFHMTVSLKLRYSMNIYFYDYVILWSCNKLFMI